jgi:flagellar motor protein MotB
MKGGVMMIPMLLLLGCVSKGDHELIQVQLDATRTALSAKNASCYEGMEQRDQQLAALERELEATRTRFDTLDQRHQQLLVEVESTRAALAELITTCAPPEPAPAPRQRRGKPPPEPEPLPPLVQASVDEVMEALALRSRSLYEREQEQVAHQAWVLAFAPMLNEGRLSLHFSHGRTTVRIPTVQLFNEGRVSISPRGELLLQGLAKALAGSDGMHIQVAAHTDNLPLHTAEHDSSWELCFDQALVVVRALEEAGVPASLSAASFAGRLPIASNDTLVGRQRNQRIELTLEALVGEAAAPVETTETEAPAGQPAGDEQGGE